MEDFENPPNKSKFSLYKTRVARAFGEGRGARVISTRSHSWVFWKQIWSVVWKLYFSGGPCRRAKGRWRPYKCYCILRTCKRHIQMDESKLHGSNALTASDRLPRIAWVIQNLSIDDIPVYFINNYHEKLMHLWNKRFILRNVSSESRFHRLDTCLIELKSSFGFTCVKINSKQLSGKQWIVVLLTILLAWHPSSSWESTSIWLLKI
jgi:hypothetical protein